MKKLGQIAAGTLAFFFSTAQAANYCGALTNGYGPYDYRQRAEYANNFYLVESAHFTSDVEAGLKGSTGSIGGDLDYTLRAIPNHYRALATMARLAVQKKTLQVEGARYPVECYFERAMRFQPTDGGVRAEYGNYLFALGKEEQAFTMYHDAAGMSPDNATINYNLGLAYFKKKDYEHALVYAQKAYALGFPLPALKNKLVEAGKWKDLPEAAPAQPAPEAAPEAPKEGAGM